MTALPAPHCFSFSLFYTLYPHALSHALARASPYCSPSHVIVLSAHCFPMYLTSFDRHLETLVSTSCLQVSPHVLRSVDTSLNTFLSPALPVEPSSSLAAQRPARRSCLSRSALLPVSLVFPLFARHPVVTLGGVVLDGAQLVRLLRQLAKLSDGSVFVVDSAEVVLEVLGKGICVGPGRGCACCHLDHVGTGPLCRRIRQPREDDHPTQLGWYSCP